MFGEMTSIKERGFGLIPLDMVGDWMMIPESMSIKKRLNLLIPPFQHG
jgi:hypothetical protein